MSFIAHDETVLEDILSLKLYLWYVCWYFDMTSFHSYIMNLLKVCKLCQNVWRKLVNNQTISPLSTPTRRNQQGDKNLSRIYVFEMGLRIDPFLKILNSHFTQKDELPPECFLTEEFHLNYRKRLKPFRIFYSQYIRNHLNGRERFLLYNCNDNSC